MSGQEAPYEIRYAPAADNAITVLPREARHALASVFRYLAADPMSGNPYDARWPPEFRTMPFGGNGLLAYVVLRRRRRIVIEHVTWINWRQMRSLTDLMNPNLSGPAALTAPPAKAAPPSTSRPGGEPGATGRDYGRELGS